MKSGYVALIGRPNVGKSTLLNHLLGQKISITSRRPQTTRHRITGIKTTEDGQAVYVDTPGMHDGGKRALNRYLNRTANSVLQDVDVIVWLTDNLKWHSDNEIILQRLEVVNCPVIFAINKVDRLKGEAKNRVMPFLQQMAERYPFSEIIPFSALHGNNLDLLEKKIIEQLPEGELIYPDDQITDRSIRFLAAEMIREKLVRQLGDELSHQLTVEIDQFDESGPVLKIHAIIWVERNSQKIIVVGQRGEVLKKVGQRARLELERLVERKIYLNLWVKVKKGWSDNEKALNRLGYLE